VARVVLACWGSYGDLFPYLAIAARLKALGHTPVVASCPFYESLVTNEGFEFRSLGPDVRSDDSDLLQRVMDPQRGSEIIVRELVPNLLPYLAATLVNAVSNAILASVGLEVLGLGPIDAPTLGMTLYWVNYNAALINGWWWWWLAPTVIIVLVFLGLFFVTVGLDEIANPRLRRSA